MSKFVNAVTGFYGKAGSAIANAILPGTGADKWVADNWAKVGDSVSGKSAQPSAPAVPPASGSTFSTTSSGKPVMTNNSSNGPVGTTYSNPTGKSAEPSSGVSLSSMANNSTSTGVFKADLTGLVTGSQTKTMGGSVVTVGIVALGLGLLWKAWKSSGNPYK